MAIRSRINSGSSNHPLNGFGGHSRYGKSAIDQSGLSMADLNAEYHSISNFLNGFNSAGTGSYFQISLSQMDNNNLPPFGRDPSTNSTPAILSPGTTARGRFSMGCPPLPKGEAVKDYTRGAYTTSSNLSGNATSLGMPGGTSNISMVDYFGTCARLQFGRTYDTVEYGLTGNVSIPSLPNVVRSRTVYKQYQASGGNVLNPGQQYTNQGGTGGVTGRTTGNANGFISNLNTNGFVPNSTYKWYPLHLVCQAGDIVCVSIVALGGSSSGAATFSDASIVAGNGTTATSATGQNIGLSFAPKLTAYNHDNNGCSASMHCFKAAGGETHVRYYANTGQSGNVGRLMVFTVGPGFTPSVGSIIYNKGSYHTNSSFAVGTSYDFLGTATGNGTHTIYQNMSPYVGSYPSDSGSEGGLGFNGAKTFDIMSKTNSFNVATNTFGSTFISAVVNQSGAYTTSGTDLKGNPITTTEPRDNRGLVAQSPNHTQNQSFIWRLTPTTSDGGSAIFTSNSA